jgi:hypothetical protein
MLESFWISCKKYETGDYERIVDFVYCRQCLKPYKYTPTIGMRYLNSHACVLNYTKTNSSIFTSTSTQIALNNLPRSLKQIQLSDKENNNFKSLMEKWIFEDLPLFTVSKDAGLKKKFQKLICLGKFVETI